jgi:hypothetical protein
MSKWQRHLKLQPEWDEAKERKIEPWQLAIVIAARLKALKPFDDYDVDGEKEELVDELECLAEDKEATFDDFDDIMHRLFDWGDTSLDNKFGGKKVCWIETF